jgi:hypothetical protein
VFKVRRSDDGASVGQSLQAIDTGSNSETGSNAETVSHMLEVIMIMSRDPRRSSVMLARLWFTKRISCAT